MVISGYISDNVKITKLQDHTVAGTSTINSDELDMNGYDGVLFVTSYGTAATGNTVTMEHSDTSGASFAATLALKTSGASDEDVLLDVNRPVKRYVRLSAARGTSSTLESIWGIQYKSRTLALDNSTTGTIALGQFNAPAAA